MKHVLVSIILLGSLTAFSQEKSKNPKIQKERIEQAKIAFLTKKLELTSEEAQQFWPIYNEKNNKLTHTDFSEDTFVDLQFTAEEIMTEQETTIFRNKNLSVLLNKLPSRQKEAIYLKYYSGLKASEISEIMGINYQSVVNTLHKAIKSLKEEISIIKLFKL